MWNPLTVVPGAPDSHEHDGLIAGRQVLQHVREDRGDLADAVAEDEGCARDTVDCLSGCCHS